MASLALVLVAVGLALVAAVGSEAFIDTSEAASAAPPLIHRSGRITLEWVRVPQPGADIRCYVTRAPTPTRAGIWICG